MSRTKQPVHLQDDPQCGTIQGQNSSTYSGREALSPEISAALSPALVDARHRGNPEASFVRQGSSTEQSPQPVQRIDENDLMHSLGSSNRILNLISQSVDNKSKPRRYQADDSPLKNQII